MRGSGAALRFKHGTKLPAGDAGEEHEHKSENAVETIGDGTKENLKSRVRNAGGLKTAGNDRYFHGDPAGHHGDPRYGRGGRIDDVCEAYPGKPDFIRDRAEHGAGDQGVSIVVEEKQHAEELPKKIGAARRFHFFCDPPCRRLKAAGFHKHANQSADENAQDHDLRVVRLGSDADQLVDNARNDLHKLRRGLFSG